MRVLRSPPTNSLSLRSITLSKEMLRSPKGKWRDHNLHVCKCIKSPLIERHDYVIPLKEGVFVGARDFLPVL